MNKEYKILTSDGFVIFLDYYIEVVPFLKSCLDFSKEEVIDISEQEINVFSIERFAYEKKKITTRLMELLKTFISIHEEERIPDYSYPNQKNIDDNRCFVFVHIPERELKMKTERPIHHTHREIEFFWQIENNVEELILLLSLSDFLGFEELNIAIIMRMASLILKGKEIFLKYYALEQLYNSKEEVTEEEKEKMFEEVVAKTRAYLVEKYTGEVLLKDVEEN